MSLACNEIDEMSQEGLVPKQVDCAIIFMLDEERDRFLEANHKFIISNRVDEYFLEFFFVDKDTQLRKGVICSYGTNMGNYAASVLFYRLSRLYKAHLYINVGVAGRIKDIDVGDVLFVDQLSSAGENNANNIIYQRIDSNTYERIDRRNSAIKEAVNFFIKGGFCFSKTSMTLKKTFDDDLYQSMLAGPWAGDISRGDEIPGVGTGPTNVCKTGWCITFPEVIKDKQEPNYKKFVDQIRQKSALIDMECYYLSEWHDLIKRLEPKHCDKDSEFIAIKSVSDCGDVNKELYEQAGSRKLAMNNLTEVVTHFCSEVYPFPVKNGDGELLQMVDEYISGKSIIRTVRDMISKCRDTGEELELIKKFEQMFKYFIRTEDPNEYGCEDSVGMNFSVLKDILLQDRAAVTICGRSGTGKTTFFALFYIFLKAHQIPVVFWAIPLFSATKYVTQRQIIYFLSRLLKNSNTDAPILLLDGVNALGKDEAVHDEFIDLLQKSHIKHLCISYGDMIDSGDGIKPIVDLNMGFNIELQFGGVCIDSDEFDAFLDAALSFFHKVHDNQLTPDNIKKLLINRDGRSKVISIDYLLLYMISEKSGLLQQKNYRYLYTFLIAYFSAKYGNKNINSFISEVYSSLVSGNGSLIIGKTFDASEMFRYNAYVEDVAYATAVCDLFKKDNDKEIEAFFTNELIFPSDITMILEDKLIEAQRQQETGRKILDAMIARLQSSTKKSAEMEIQILYTACSLGRNNQYNSQQLKEIVYKKRNHIMEEIERVGGNEQKLLMLQYRTLCIILALFFEEEDNLAEYNEKLIDEEATSLTNIIFHLYYYSGRFFSYKDVISFGFFSYKDVISFDITNIHDEMFYNTYYVLAKTFMIKSEQSSVTDQFTLYNFITFLHLCKHVIIPNNRYPYIKDKAKRIFDSYAATYRKMSPSKIKFYDKLIRLINEINF